MAVYNGEKFLKEAIESVLAQSYSNLELLIVNDGSTDQTENIINQFSDSRIASFNQINKGVSAARNLALSKMKGDYFCFLDADDIYPKHSIKWRMSVLEEDPSVKFAHGVVHYVDSSGHSLNYEYKPAFKGEPFNRLLRLDSKCMFGNTWLIKKDQNQTYKFEEKMKHSEDLLFYLSICQGGKLSYTEKTILLYRQHPNSAMKNISGLEKGYISLIKNIKENFEISFTRRLILKIIISKIMFLSFLRISKDVKKAVNAPFKVIAS